MTVWILVAMISNGHFGYSGVPTVEFKTEESCKAAVASLTNAVLTKDVNGRFTGYCVRIEK